MAGMHEKIVSIPRTQAELEQIGREVIAYLGRLCDDYDHGNTFAIVLIAVVLRTLLKSKGDTKSVLKHLGLEDIPFIDTSVPRASFSFWNFEDHICNHTFLTQNVYGGLLHKRVKNGENGLVLDFEPLLGANRLAKTTSFEEWYKAVVFENAEFRLSREECINEVADKDGGAHLDKLIHANYACFRQPTALQFIIDGEVARFNQNPVYVSLRQIAWEVLESLKEIQS